jgi:hypothetical protein
VFVTVTDVAVDENTVRVALLMETGEAVAKSLVVKVSPASKYCPPYGTTKVILPPAFVTAVTSIGAIILYGVKVIVVAVPFSTETKPPPSDTTVALTLAPAKKYPFADSVNVVLELAVDGF